MKKPKVILFDYGETLVTGTPTSYVERIVIGVQSIRPDLEYKTVEEAYVQTDYEMYKLYRSQSIEEEDFFPNFGRLFFAALGMKGDAEQYGRQLIAKIEQLKFRRVAMKGATEVLDKLQSDGCHLGIVSNNDGRAAEKCREVGIEGYFYFIIDSAIEGVRKPNRRIFELALHKADALPEEAMHVGDLYGSDVLGAMDVGIRAVWFNHRNNSPPAERPPDFEIRHLRELINILS